MTRFALCTLMGAPYLLPAVNQNEPQYALPDAAYPP